MIVESQKNGGELLPIIASILHASPGTPRKQVSQSVIDKQIAIASNCKTTPSTTFQATPLRSSRLMQFEATNFSTTTSPVRSYVATRAPLSQKPTTRVAASNIANRTMEPSIDRKNYIIEEKRVQVVRRRFNFSPNSLDNVETSGEVSPAKRDLSTGNDPVSATSSGYFSDSPHDNLTPLARLGESSLYRDDENPYLLPVSGVPAQKPVSPVHDATDSGGNSDDEVILRRGNQRGRPLPRPPTDCPSDFAPPAPHERGTIYEEIVDPIYEEYVAKALQFMEDNDSTALCDLLYDMPRVDAKDLFRELKKKNKLEQLYRVRNGVPVLEASTLGKILTDKNISAFLQCKEDYYHKEFSSVLKELRKDGRYISLHEEMVARIEEQKKERQQPSATYDDDIETVGDKLNKGPEGGVSTGGNIRNVTVVLPQKREKSGLMKLLSRKSRKPSASDPDHVVLTRGKTLDVTESVEDMQQLKPQKREKTNRHSRFPFRKSRNPSVSVKRSTSDPVHVRLSSNRGKIDDELNKHSQKSVVLTRTKTLEVTEPVEDVRQLMFQKSEKTNRHSRFPFRKSRNPSVSVKRSTSDPVHVRLSSNRGKIDDELNKHSQKSVVLTRTKTLDVTEPVEDVWKFQKNEKKSGLSKLLSFKKSGKTRNGLLKESTL